MAAHPPSTRAARASAAAAAKRLVSRGRASRILSSDELRVDDVDAGRVREIRRGGDRPRGCVDEVIVFWPLRADVVRNEVQRRVARSGSCGAGHRENEVRAGSRLGPELESTPMDASVFQGDRKSETGAADRALPRRVRAPET